MATNKDKCTHHNYFALLTDDVYHKPKLIKNTRYDQYYKSKLGNESSVRQYILLVMPHLPTLINKHKNEYSEWGIQLIMQICFIDPNERPTHPPNLFNRSKEIKPIGESYIYEVSSNVEEIKFDIDTNKVTYQLVKTLLHCYEDMIETSDYERDLVFNYICSFACHVCKI